MCIRDRSWRDTSTSSPSTLCLNKVSAATSISSSPYLPSNFLISLISSSFFSASTSSAFPSLLTSVCGLSSFPFSSESFLASFNKSLSDRSSVKLSKSSQLVVIDEAQFFDEKIIEVCIALSKRKIDIILAGLDLDYLGNPFGPMPKLMKIANKISHLHAICDICKKKEFCLPSPQKKRRNVLYSALFRV